MRAIRLFIKEGEGSQGKAVVQEKHQGSPAGGEEKRTSVTYQPSEQASARVREEDFAKQLRLARYLAGASLGSPRAMEKVADKARSVTKPRSKAKKQPRDKKGAEAELARERRRAQQLGRQKASSPGRGRSEKQRSGPSR
jgi:hypothetical protein